VEVFGERNGWQVIISDALSNFLTHTMTFHNLMTTLTTRGDDILMTLTKLGEDILMALMLMTLALSWPFLTTLTTLVMTVMAFDDAKKN